MGGIRSANHTSTTLPRIEWSTPDSWAGLLGQVAALEGSLGSDARMVCVRRRGLRGSRRTNGFQSAFAAQAADPICHRVLGGTHPLWRFIGQFLTTRSGQTPGSGTSFAGTKASMDISSQPALTPQIHLWLDRSVPFGNDYSTQLVSVWFYALASTRHAHRVQRLLRDARPAA